MERIYINRLWIFVWEYFSIGKQSVSDWRTDNHIPPKRLIEFLEKEGLLEPLELIKKLY